MTEGRKPRWPLRTISGWRNWNRRYGPAVLYDGPNPSSRVAFVVVNEEDAAKFHAFARRIEAAKVSARQARDAEHTAREHAAELSTALEVERARVAALRIIVRDALAGTIPPEVVR